MTHSPPLPALLVFLLMALAGAPAPAQPGRLDEIGSEPDAPAFSRLTPEAWVVKQVGGAVVSISAGTGRRDIFDMSLFPGGSQGSGVVIAPEGYIITNNHVIQGAQNIRVQFNQDFYQGEGDGTFPAQLIATNPDEDLALLKIDARGAVPAVKIGSSADLMIGEKVVAIGNPFGRQNTVSSGILSAVGREIQVNDPHTGRLRTFRGLLQTDASINPGNSGGPLLNVHAELIGINNAVLRSAQGISFAIPVDKVTEILERSFFNVNETTRFYLGFAVVQRGERPIATRLDRSSPAWQAGLRDGDVLVAVNGQETPSVQDFARAALASNAGDVLKLRVRGSEGARDLAFRLPEFHAGFLRTRLGLTLKVHGLAGRFGSQIPILVVEDVVAGSPAAATGLARGDYLLGIGSTEAQARTMGRRSPIDSPQALATAIRRALPAEGTLTVQVFIYRPSDREYYVGPMEI